MTPTRLLASVILGCVLLALLAFSLYAELRERWERRPYVRDFKRAHSIRQHSLLQMPARQWLAEAEEICWRELEKQS